MNNFIAAALAFTVCCSIVSFLFGWLWRDFQDIDDHDAETELKPMATKKEQLA